MDTSIDGPTRTRYSLDNNRVCYNIPTMQFLTKIQRNTQSKSEYPKRSENSEIMHHGILFMLPYRKKNNNRYN